jgi:hypothetical protein
MGNTNSSQDGFSGSTQPNDWPRSSLPPPPPGSSSTISSSSFQNPSITLRPTINQPSLTTFSPTVSTSSSSAMDIDSNVPAENLDQFFQIMDHIRKLESERDRVLQEKTSLEAQLAHDNEIYLQELENIDRHCKTVVDNYRLELQQQMEFQIAKFTASKQEELENKIAHLNNHLIPERQAMAEEDQLSTAVETVSRQYRIIHDRLKAEYTEKLRNNLKVSKAEYAKAIEKFQNEREAEYEALASSKVSFNAIIFKQLVMTIIIVVNRNAKVVDYSHGFHLQANVYAIMR